MSIYPCIECDDEVKPRQQALQLKVFMALLETKKEFVKLTKRPWVRNDYLPNEQRCILLWETNNVSLCC